MRRPLQQAIPIDSRRKILPKDCRIPVMERPFCSPWLGHAGVWPLVLPQNLAALGRSPPVLELEGCFYGASIGGEVMPRRSQAARETTAICIFADSSCGNAPAPIRRPCQRPNIRSEAV